MLDTGCSILDIGNTAYSGDLSFIEHREASIQYRFETAPWLTLAFDQGPVTFDRCPATIDLAFKNEDGYHNPRQSGSAAS